jgi:hypothetical protein
MAPDSLPEPLEIALEFSGILEALGVAHIVAGSLASSIYGRPRTTNDIDIVADLRPRHLEPFCAALAAGYYLDRDTAAAAIRDGTSFNAIHLGSSMKVDVFVVGEDRFDGARVAQGRPVPLAPGRTLKVDRAEFTLIRKLEWFRRGGEVSDRQWQDILAILRIQAATLDRTMLDEWTPRLGVVDLLARAEREARQS